MGMRCSLVSPDTACFSSPPRSGPGTYPGKVASKRVVFVPSLVWHDEPGPSL